VAHAHDGLQGLEAARRAKPDVVISDIDMPGLDGFEMCRQLKADPTTRDVPILILSARGAGVDIDRGFDVGANDFLTKPVSENELTSRVEHVLRRGASATEGRETILVVEDSAVQRSVVVQALSQQGFTVLAAENGREGLDLAMRTPPDLVITDAEMPVMNGRDLTRELKRRDRLRDVPVMMLTAADSDASRAKGRHAGVAAYLTKPFVPDKVVVIAEKLIGERRLLRERQAMQRYLSDAAVAAASEAAAAEGDVDSVMRAETRDATILFSDIVGFTPLTERMVPADLVGLLNSYFDAMAPLFREHGGVIDKLIGDAIMATFVGEGPDGPADAAVRAVTTGLAMLDAIARFNEDRAEPLQVRIGINSGDVVMGDIGSRHHRRDYTAIGDHVNVAARLESRARPGTVLISASTYDRVKDRFEAERVGPIQVKGKTAPITVYEVRGPRGS
jgi:adenylate cyclase